jgi:hypothetical protein
MKRIYFYGPVLMGMLLVITFRDRLPKVALPLLHPGYRTHTVGSRLDEFGEIARMRWKPFFDRSGVTYPPTTVTLVGLKEEKRLEIYARDSRGELSFIREFQICAASGSPGPKLMEGDRQVPEGIYKVSFLNPNSAYHVSLRLDYPNSFDQARAELDGRTNLGGDIMIHGKCVSVGCLAMGDEAAEDLFVLTADTGISNTTVVLAPFDFRRKHTAQNDSLALPTWISDLYTRIKFELEELPRERKNR